MQTQRITTKKPYTKKFRFKKAKLTNKKISTLPYFKFNELGKTFSINKRKNYLKKKQKQKNNTLVTGDNANIVKDGEKK